MRGKVSVFACTLLTLTVGVYAATDPVLLVTALSGTELEIQVNWNEVSASAKTKYNFGLYRAKGAKSDYLLKKEIEPHIDNIIRVSNLEPGYDYMFKVQHVKKDQTLADTLRWSSPDAVGRLKSEGNWEPADAPPVERRSAPAPSGTAEEGVFVGALSFAGRVEQLSKTAAGGTNGIIKLDSAGLATLRGIINQDYRPSADFGTSLFYSVHQALANLKEADDKHSLPSKVDTVMLITFTDGLDTSSTDTTLPILEGQDFHAPKNPLLYRNYISSEIRNRTIAGRRISAYSFGLRGRDVANEADFASTLQSIASSIDNAHPMDNVSSMNGILSRIAEDLEVNRTDPRVEVTVSMPAYPAGTTVRISFDYPSLDAGIYLDARITVQDGTYALSDIITHGDIAVLERGPITATRTRQSPEYKFTVNRNFMEHNVRQWSLAPGGGSGSWQSNSEFLVQKQEGYVQERRSVLIYFVLDASSSLSDANTQAVRNAISQFVNQIYEKSVRGGSLPMIGSPPPAYSASAGESYTPVSIAMPSSSSYSANGSSYSFELSSGGGGADQDSQPAQWVDSRVTYVPATQPIRQSQVGEPQQAEKTEMPSSLGTGAAAAAAALPVSSAPAAYTTKTVSAPAPAAPAQSYSGYWVQVASYVEPALAERVRLVLSQNGVNNVVIFTQERLGRVYNQVRVGPYASRTDAETTLRKLKSSPFEFVDSFYLTIP